MMKDVLDVLYAVRFGLAEKSRKEHSMSFQLPDTDVSGRNLAAGRSQAFSDATQEVDEAIETILKFRE